MMIPVTVYRVHGELDAVNFRRMEMDMRGWLQNDRLNFIVDLSDCPHVWFNVLDSFQDLAQRLQDYKGQMVLVGVSSYLKQCLDWKGHRYSFTIYKDEVEALGALGGERVLER